MTILTKIKSILDTIEGSTEDEARARRIKKYWQIGKLVNQYKERTGKTVQEIAKEINVHKTLMQRYSQFNTVYSEGYIGRYADKVVKWYMFIEVLRLKNKKERDFYLEQACTQDWDKYEFKRRINADYYHTFKEAKSYKALNKLTPKNQTLYTYSAWVKRVVDGDTLVLDIDVGFKTTQEHRVRLRGIDCPEMSTQEGERAKKFVEDELNKCIIKDENFLKKEPTPPLIVIKTYKQGMYGRYIADVYYLPGENKAENIAKTGKLLNQILLDKGFARRMG